MESVDNALMTSNYQKIIAQNLQAIYRDRAHELEHLLPAGRDGELFRFKAFGEEFIFLCSKVVGQSVERDFIGFRPMNPGQA